MLSFSSKAEVLANYECEALEFLYPSPKVNHPATSGHSSSSSNVAVRELLLNRTFKMPGISPKLTFKSTSTVVDVPLEEDRPGFGRGGRAECGFGKDGRTEKDVAEGVGYI